jgi:hypothetical protein
MCIPGQVMLEIRIYEVNKAEVPMRIDARSPMRVSAIHGTLWITLERQAWDIWISEGECFDLTSPAVAWVGSAHPRARFSLASAPDESQFGCPRLIRVVKRWIENWQLKY